MEYLLYMVVPLVWAVSTIALCVHLLVMIVKKIRGVDCKKPKYGALISCICSLVTFIIIGAYDTSNVTVEDDTAADETVAVETEAETETKETPLLFLDDLGYTDEQADAMREILLNVGISEITDLEIGAVSYGMQTIKGILYRDNFMGKEVQVRLNIENGVLYYVHIYCPSYHTANQPTYLSGLEDRRAELYYEGYKKKIDWENRVVIEY